MRAYINKKSICKSFLSQYCSILDESRMRIIYRSRISQSIIYTRHSFIHKPCVTSSSGEALSLQHAGALRRSKTWTIATPATWLSLHCRTPLRSAKSNQNRRAWERLRRQYFRVLSTFDIEIKSNILMLFEAIIGIFGNSQKPTVTILPFSGAPIYHIFSIHRVKISFDAGGQNVAG